MHMNDTHGGSGSYTGHKSILDAVCHALSNRMYINYKNKMSWQVLSFIQIYISFE